MATATMTAKAVKGFGVACPLCGSAEDGAVSLDLNEITVLHCATCGEDFTPVVAVRKAAEQLRRWEAVARWVALAGECLSGE